MMKTMKLIPLAALLALTGCVNLAPEYQRPAAPVEQAWPQGEAYQNAKLRSEALPAWQDYFTDEKLRRVIALGLENNRDMRIAALNVDKARALYRVQRADLLPTVNAAFANAGQRTPSSMTGGSASVSHTYTAELALASYEIDFFGKIRNLTEEALQSYFATEDARRSTRNSLISQIAIQWLTLGADKEQLALQKEILATQEESFHLIEESYKVGASSRLDYEQAKTTVTAARAAIASYIRAVAQDENALELLCGAKVPPELLPDSLSRSATLTATLPPGLPSEVLLNRPDIMQAERSLISANADIGVARAAFFPSVSLTGGIGSGAMHLSDLFDSGTRLWTFTPNVSLPIFTGGANVANLEAAKAQQKIAAATYEQTIQSAFREVADALSTEGTIDEELAARREYAASAEKTFELQDASYKAGASSYSDLLTAQRSMVSAKQTLISTELSRASSAITLYNVLGGGAIEKEEPAAQQQGTKTASAQE
jgi:multidrug efflux system outer membrane protein